MINFILMILINSMWIWGVNCLFSEDHLLEKPGDWLDEHLPVWIVKPLFGCPACMASIHGTAGYFLSGNTNFLLWVPYCVCLCGLNYIIIKITKKHEVQGQGK